MTELRERKVTLSVDDAAYEDLRADFSVEKTVKSSINTATITVYNLSRASAARIADAGRDQLIRLFAGYDIPQLIFQGNPTKAGVEVVKEGPDRIVRIKAGDGYKNYVEKIVNVSWQSQVRVSEVLDRLVAELGLPRGVISVPDDKLFVAGGNFYGNVADVLDELQASVDSDWSIQDGAVQFLPRSQVRAENLGPLYSTENKTLIGSPQVKDGKLVSLRVLLDPGLLPGDRFVLQHEEQRMNGAYKAIKVKHQGSQWGSDFYTEIEAKRYDAVQ